MLIVTIDWSLAIVAVKSRRNVLRSATTTATLRISLRRNAPNYLRWVDRQQRRVFCFFTPAPFISASTIRYRIWHIYQRTMLQPGPPHSLFSSFAADCSTEQAFLTHLDLSGKKGTWLIPTTSLTHYCSFCISLALLPGDPVLSDLTRYGPGAIIKHVKRCSMSTWCAHVACATMRWLHQVPSHYQETRFWVRFVWKESLTEAITHDSSRLYRKSTREIPSSRRGRACKLTIVEAAAGQSEPLSRWIVIIALASGDADRCCL